MKEVHFITQGKGGVGKSFISAIFAQFITDNSNETVHCFDTDPVNPTFSRYQALSPKIIKILNSNNNIDSRQFDGLIEQILEADGIGVIDNGAATFIPLMSYIAENQISELLKESNIRLIFHVPLAGGQALSDCLKGLNQILSSNNAEVVVWLNDFQGKVEADKPFTDFKIFKSYQDKILGIVNIAERNPDTFGKDIKQMTERNLTFKEIDSSPDFSLMPKQRLRTIKRDIYSQLANIQFLGARNVKTTGN